MRSRFEHTPAVANVSTCCRRVVPRKKPICSSGAVPATRTSNPVWPARPGLAVIASPMPALPMLNSSRMRGPVVA
jgi:hypothetical protein